MAKPSTGDSTTLAEWLNISHELRTPANAILGHLDLLLSGSLGPLSSEARQSLGDIQKASANLLEQIQRSIEIGQKLSYPASNQDKAIERLAHSLHQAWELRRKRSHSTDHSPDQPASQPDKWPHVVATILHGLDVKLLPQDQWEEKQAGLADALNDSCQFEWRFQYQHDRCRDDEIALSMIEAALAAVGGSLRFQPGQLILVWPTHDPEASEHITA